MIALKHNDHLMTKETLHLPTVGPLLSFVTAFFNLAPPWIWLSSAPLSLGPEDLDDDFDGAGGGGAPGGGGGGGGILQLAMKIMQ